MTVQYSEKDFEPSDWYRFVDLDPFAREWARYGLTDRDMQALEVAIMAFGEKAPVIPGTGGLRKLRFAPPGQNRGKRGSYRVGFVLLLEYGTVLLITLYGKSNKSDLTDYDCQVISKVIAKIEHKLSQGVIK